MTEEDLPLDRRAALSALRESVSAAFGEALYGLYVYGALCFPESEGITDLDYHAILDRRPQPGEVRAYRQACAKLARDHAPWGADLDGWVILRAQAAGSEPPAHLIRPDLRDLAWALHRAHWLAGRCLVLRGPPPGALVASPTWPELESALVFELDFARGSDDDAFCVLNCCRILHSVMTRDVVHSKFGSAAWGLSNLPPEHHPALRAAMATYRREATAEDAVELRRGRPPFVDYVTTALNG